MKSFPALSLLLVSLLAAEASATWSIVLVNVATGEVGIGSATCLSNFNLKKGAGVIVVGKGAGQAQALVDSSGAARKAIFDGLKAGKTAEEILQDALDAATQDQQRQYGIATLNGDAATFTGSQTIEWSNGVTGSSGPIFYAIQGNILTCQSVIDAAEQALISTPGDLGLKLMASMQAARSFGGDGRCSCTPQNPQCGCPPASFTKSAHVGYMTIARIGDTDGTCSAATGCANGVYYMDLNVIQGAGAPNDPVVVLQGLFDTFRAGWAGHADHILSTKAISPDPLLADGQSQATLTVLLVDIDGNPLTAGGASVTVTHDATSAGAASIGAVTDHGDGSYTVPLTAGFATGTDVYRIVVDDGKGPVTLYPFPTLTLVTPPLLADVGAISSKLGDPVHFTLTGGAAAAGKTYAILGTASGTIPGFDVGAVHVPINPDLFTVLTFAWSHTPIFVGGIGMFDPSGNASATFDPKKHMMTPWIGSDLSFAWVTVIPAVDQASNPVCVTVNP